MNTKIYISNATRSIWYLKGTKWHVKKQAVPVYHYRKEPDWKKRLIIAIVVVLTLLICVGIARAQIAVSANLWKGLIAESTKGDLAEYRAIASVVRNRINKGMWHGLVALKRKNLDAFVAREIKHNPKLEALAKQAVNDTKDHANGATHYEHTKTYPVPSWAKKMKVVKVLFAGTKHEITFWKEVRE